MQHHDIAIETDVLDLGGGRLQGRAVLKGELDVASTEHVEERLHAVLDAGAHDLIVDTTEVTFLDSSGLRALVHARNLVEEAGGSFLIDGMSPAVHRVLDLCGMLDLGSRPPV